MENNEVEFKLTLSDDILFSELGNDLIGVQALPISTRELIEIGKRWFDKQYNYLQSIICSNEDLKKFTLEKSENGELVTEIGKLLASLLLPVNPINVAVILVKKGLRTFCKTHWD